MATCEGPRPITKWSSSDAGFEKQPRSRVSDLEIEIEQIELSLQSKNKQPKTLGILC